MKKIIRKQREWGRNIFENLDNCKVYTYDAQADTRRRVEAFEKNLFNNNFEPICIGGFGGLR